MSTVIPISPEVAMTRACADVTRPCPFCGQIDKAESPALDAASWNHRTTI